MQSPNSEDRHILVCRFMFNITSRMSGALCLASRFDWGGLQEQRRRRAERAIGTAGELAGRALEIAKRVHVKQPEDDVECLFAAFDTAVAQLRREAKVRAVAAKTGMKVSLPPSEVTPQMIEDGVVW